MRRCYVVERWIAGVLIAACALVIAGRASARGRKQQFFRVELRTGQVQAVARGTEPPVVRWPSPVNAARRSITSDGRTLLVYDETPGDPADRAPTWQYTLPGSGAGSIAWSLLRGNTVVYAWREDVPGQPYQYRDIVRAMDMPRRKVLWERVLPAHMPPGAVGIGTDRLVVDQAYEVLVLETTTGRVVRRLAKSEPSFAVARPSPGRVWVEAGSVIECIDEATTNTIWRASKQGQLLWLLPIPGGDWLMKTASHAYRVRAADGHAVWSSPSASASRPLLHGDRIYEGTLVADVPHRRAQMVVVERDLQSGKVTREYPIGTHDTFFDQGSVTAVEARDGWVDVTTDFLILD